MKSSTFQFLLPLLFLCLAAGCGSSTAPIMDAVMFEGELVAGGRVIHPLVLSSSGTLHIEFTRLEEKPVEGVEPADGTWAVGLGVGRPAGEECSTTYSASARVGDLVVLGLNEAEYCFAIFDSGFVPDDTVLEYTLSVSPANT